MISQTLDLTSINKKVFDTEANSYQTEFFEQTLGSKYVNQIEQQLVTDILQSFDKNANLNILDIGAGGGRWSQLLLSAFPNAKVTAVDLSTKMIDNLRKKYYAESRFEAIESDVKNLAFADNTFDIIVSIRVLKYSENQTQTFSQIHRVLKPGGSAIIEFPYNNFIYKIVKKLNFGKISEYAKRIVLQDINQINTLLNECQLQIVEQKLVFCLPATFYKKVNNNFGLSFFKILNKILPKSVFGRSVFLKIKK